LQQQQQQQQQQSSSLFPLVEFKNDDLDDNNLIPRSCSSSDNILGGVNTIPELSIDDVVPTLTSTPLSTDTNSSFPPVVAADIEQEEEEEEEEEEEDEDYRTDIFSTCLAPNTNLLRVQHEEFRISFSNDESDAVEVPDLEALLAPHSPVHNRYNNTMMGSDDPRLRLLEFQSDIDLLDRNTTSVSSSSSAASYSSSPSSAQRQQQQMVIKQIIDTVGQVIDTADRELQQLDESSISMGLLRACQQLADSVGHVAEQIEHHPEKRQLARACLQDFQNNNHDESLRLYTSNATIPTSSSKEDDASDWIHNENTTTPTTVLENEEDEMINAMGVAAELLRDVEAALRAISQDEADEIAQVGLIVAHLFVASLQQMHSRIVTPQQQQQQRKSNSRYQESPNIESVEEEETETTAPASSNSKNSNQTDRRRCLWPPIGPEVAKALRWSKDELDKQHWILTVALGITLWPVAVMGTLLGTPAIVTDHCIQTLYQHFQNGPILTAAEMAAAQLYQTSRLCWITGKTMARPTWRVATRQLQRHGPDIQEWMIHRITHPVQTIGETMSGIAWVSGQVVHAIQGFLAQREEERTRVPEMQI
jgi:hypothetical protein